MWETPGEAYARMPSHGELDLGTSRAAIHVFARRDHTCALLSNGKARCWGNSYSGIGGYAFDATYGFSETPAMGYALMGISGDLDLGPGRVVRIAPSLLHGCALLEGGNVRCYGRTESRALGYVLTDVPWGSIGGGGQSPGQRYASMPNGGNVEVGGEVVDICAGEQHTCALLSNGALRCWGMNTYGAKGYGSYMVPGYAPPSAEGDVPVGARVTDLACGSYHTCVLTDAGTARCFGGWGPLGYGLPVNHFIGDDETPAMVGDVEVF